MNLKFLWRIYVVKSREHRNQVKMLCKRSTQEAGQTETFFFSLSHSQQRTRAGASTLAPALTSSFSNVPGYFCNSLWLFVFFFFSGFAELMNSLVPP